MKYKNGLRILIYISCNFAPLSLRRDIAMLGLIYKRVLGQAHPAYEDLLPMAPASWYQQTMFRPAHCRQIDSGLRMCIFNHDLWNRSIFGKVGVFNELPHNGVECKTISEFQHELTVIAKRKCQQGVPDWRHCFSSRRWR